MINSFPLFPNLQRGVVLLPTSNSDKWVFYDFLFYSIIMHSLILHCFNLFQSTKLIILFWGLNCLNFDQWYLLHIGSQMSDITPWIFAGTFAFWQKRSQIYLFPFPLRLESTISPRSLGFFPWRTVIEATAWAQGLLIAVEITSLLEVFKVFKYIFKKSWVIYNLN